MRFLNRRSAMGEKTLKQLAIYGINEIIPTPVMDMPYMDRKPV